MDHDGDGGSGGNFGGLLCLIVWNVLHCFPTVTKIHVAGRFGLNV